MPAQMHFRSPSSNDAAILTALDKIAAELEQDTKLCRVTVEVMPGYQPGPELLLSEIQSQPFAEHARQHESASWQRVWIRFERLQLNVSLKRDRDQGDQKQRAGPVPATCVPQ